MSDLDNMFENMLHDTSESVMGPARQQLADDMITADEKGQATPEYLKTLVKLAKIGDEEAVKIARLLPDDLSKRFMHMCMKINHPIKYRLGMDIPVVVRE